MADKIQQFYYKKSRLQQLKGFCYTFQLNSISKAADKMGLSPTAVTLQIQALEDDLNVSLFIRNGRSIKPTDDASELYNMSIPLIQEIDGVFSYFKQKNLEKSNSIRIAAHHTAMTYIIPGYIKKFSENNPNVKIVLQCVSKEEALKRIRDEKTDLALYPMSSIPVEFECFKKMTYDPVLLMSKNHPLATKRNISLEDIGNYKTILVDKKAILPAFVSIFEKYGITSNIEFENGDWEIVRQFLKMNMGVSFFSSLYDNLHDSDIVSKKISKYFPDISFSLVAKKGKIQNHNVKEFLLCE